MDKPFFKLERNNAAKYSGSSKMIDLEEWLATTVNRLALQRLGRSRPEIDQVRVMLLLEQLLRAAHKWMLRHVTHINWEIEHRTFQDVIHGLYTWFVHPSSMQDAWENLNKVQYIPRDGIQTMYDSMLEHAREMAVFPDNYTMLSIFLDKIPQYMISELLNLWGLLPEVNNLSEFVGTSKAWLHEPLLITRRKTSPPRGPMTRKQHRMTIRSMAVQKGFHANETLEQGQDPGQETWSCHGKAQQAETTMAQESNKGKRQ